MKRHPTRCLFICYNAYVFSLFSTVLKPVVTTAFPYELRTTKRTKRLRVTIYPGGRVVVSYPSRATKGRVEKFMRENMSWIALESERMKGIVVSEKKLRGRRSEYLLKKESARLLVHERLAHFNQHYAFSYNAVSIKNLSSRWGSCSMKKNLNFHYKILDLAPELVDYLIVHELCHIKEFNHGKGFWNLVSETIPKCEVLRKELRTLYS